MQDMSKVRRIYLEIPDQCTKAYKAIGFFRCVLKFGHSGNHKGKLKNFDDLYTFPEEGSIELLETISPLGIKIEEEASSGKRKYLSVEYEEYRTTVLEKVARDIKAQFPRYDKVSTFMTSFEKKLIEISIRAGWERLWELRAIEDGHREEEIEEGGAN